MELQLGANVIGYFRDETGVGEIPRAIVQALHGAHCPVCQITLRGYSGVSGGQGGLPPETANPSFVNLLNVNADQVPVVYREHPELFRNHYNIGFWFWELAEFPNEWRDRFRVLDEIWTASRFVQDALLPVSPIPVLRMPVPLSVPLPSSLTREHFGLVRDHVVFLFVFDMRSYGERKNPLGVVRAYRRAFAPDFSRTSLVIKANHAHLEPRLAATLAKEVAEADGVYIDRSMNRQEVNGLFDACDAYVSLHRSEGLGLTMAEAMIRGKAVIATAYSGNLDFMTPENSYLVGYKLIPLTQDHGPYRRGCVWADPSEEEAADAMRRVVEDRAEALRKGELAREQVGRQFSRDAAASAIIRRIDEIRKFRS